MPPAPTFNYYAELQVGQNASTEELTASYRRLARIHHPDKNPGNREQATAAFQKIALAYEVLSDPAQRARYDARSSFGPARQGPAAAAGSRSRYSSYHYAEDDDYDYDFDDDDDDDDTFFGFDEDGSFPRYYHADGFFDRFFPGGAHFAFRSGQRTAEEEAARKAFQEEQDKNMREQLEAMQKARLERERAEEERRRAKEAAKKAEEDAKTVEKAGRRAVEQAKQEARWEKLGARTTAEKLDACLHSEFCAKVTHKQKVKCHACAAKRGMTAFECPYCAMYLCQLCVTKFGVRRAKVEKTPEPEPEPEPKPVTEPEPRPEPRPEPAGKANGGKTDKKPGKFGGKSKKNGFRSKASGAGERACYRCGREGHQAKNCPDRNATNPQQKNAGNAKAENGTRKDRTNGGP